MRLQSIRRARTPGEELEPTQLIARVAREEHLLSALSDYDTTSDFFSALHEQFGLIGHAPDRWTPSDEVQGNWVKLVRWMVRELREWHPDTDPKGIRVVTLLVVAQYFAGEENIWAEMPDDLKANQQLLSLLARFASRLTVDFIAVEDAPIWEREKITSLADADAREDWPQLRNLWPRLQALVHSNFFSIQLSKFLAHYDLPRLAQATAGISTSCNAMQFSVSLDRLSNLRLALASDNKYIQFSSVFDALGLGIRRPLKLSAQERDKLTQLLLKVSADESQWRGWMKAFGGSPHGGLEESLGAALVTAPHHALEAYIESLDLKPPSAGSRDLAAQGLRTFRDMADLPRRQQLWTLAFQRWSRWDFNAESPDTHMSSIAGTELDFAIVGYALECLTAEQRTQAREQVADGLQAILLTWHASRGGIISSWNRWLSRYQPYAHAEHVLAFNQDWLYQPQYLPFHREAEPYAVMMFQVH